MERRTHGRAFHGLLPRNAARSMRTDRRRGHLVAGHKVNLRDLGGNFVRRRLGAEAGVAAATSSGKDVWRIRKLDEIPPGNQYPDWGFYGGFQKGPLATCCCNCGC